MDTEAKLSLMSMIAKYAIDHGYEVSLSQNDLKTDIHEVVNMSNQSFTDNGFLMRVYPFIIPGELDDDDGDDDDDDDESVPI